MRELVRCSICDARKYPAEVKLNLDTNEYICRDSTGCYKRKIKNKTLKEQESQ